MFRMLQVVLLWFLLGSAQSFTVPRDVVDENKETPDNSTEDDDFSISDLLEKANKNLGKRLSGPVVTELDIAVGYGLQNADPCTAKDCLWPKSKDGTVYVPYQISDQYSKSERAIIEDGLRSFSKRLDSGPVTCIRFIPRVISHDYLDIQSIYGCYSFVGKQGGVQNISLDKNGCLSKGTVQHELLHALGFKHEQSRSDRDCHVEILWDNIKPGKENNFRKVDTNNLNTPYDYSSIMHYGRTYFSKNDKPTIVPIPDPNVAIGTAKQMSHNDILRINRLYNC